MRAPPFLCEGRSVTYYGSIVYDKISQPKYCTRTHSRGVTGVVPS